MRVYGTVHLPRCGLHRWIGSLRLDCVHLPSRVDVI